MKKFYIHILSYLSILLLFFSICLVCNRLAFHQIKKNHYTGIETLILGDSHVEWLNEKIISNSKNLFQGQDNYLTIYNKLASLHQHNPQLKNVILSYSYLNVGGFYEKEMSQEHETLKRNYQLVATKDLIKISDNFENTKKIISKQLMTLNAPAITNLLFGDEKYLHYDGGLKYKAIEECAAWYNNHLLNDNIYTRNRLDTSNYNKKVKGTIWYHYRQWNNMSGPLSISFLEKIVAYCTLNNLNILLLSTPLDPAYKKGIPDAILIQYANTLEDLRREYNLTHLDYADLFADDINLMKDPNHMNEYGGAVVSQKVIAFLE